MAPFEDLRPVSPRTWIISLPFVFTVAVSSASLFILQPMCARMVLPYLGGSTSVWTTCMLFFQAGLLGGYLYAHTAGRIGIRTHAALHLVLVALACAFLPPALGRPFVPEGDGSPVIWLLANLMATIGLPYLVLASSAPLVQVWLARSAATAETDPYFLYAASNAGSLLGLLAYPLLLEPLLSLRQQSIVWSGCFGLFAVSTAVCALTLWKRRGDAELERSSPKPPRRSEATKAPSIKSGLLIKWLILAFLPSSLLLSVTVHLTADVASLPLLWVVPLGAYLLTYIVAFSGRVVGTHHFWVRWLPLVILILAIVLVADATEPALLIVVLHLLGLFWIGMVCHGNLASSRPPVVHLTTFYLCIAVGGALGGVFNALLAPALFDRLVEYPAALVLACFIPAFASHPAPTDRASSWQRKLDFIAPALLALLAFGLAFGFRSPDAPADRWRSGIILGLPLIVCYTFSGRPIRFGLGIAALLLCHGFSPGIYGQSVERVRSFFGVHRITRDAHHRVLIHGNTEHGRQSLDPARRRDPLTYYTQTGPLGEVFAALTPAEPRLQSVAVLGLGAGTMAAYSQPGQHWTFYEIDPSLVGLARNHFTYLQDAIDRGAKMSIVPGDARFQISRTREQYGLIILDAFSSDSIPTHLFTSEALQVYRERLTKNGALVIHYSSRYFDLRPVLGKLAKAANPPLTAMFREDLWLTDGERSDGKTASKWAILVQAGSDPLLSALPQAGWLPIESGGHGLPWTDDHANIWEALQLSPE